MKLTHTLLVASAIPLALLLAGCEHSKRTAESAGDPNLVPGSVIAAETGDTAVKALNDGKTLAANSATTTAVAINYNDNTAQVAAPQSFAIKKNGSGGVDMIVNGETVSFADTDKAPDDPEYGWEKDPDANGNYKSLFSYTGKTADVLDGTDSSYLQVWRYDSASDGDTKNLNGFAVVGAETKAETVKSHANATYSGWSEAEMRQESNRRERTRVAGNLTLAADFEGGSVSGKVENLEAKTRGAASPNVWVPTAPINVASNIEMTKANISGNGFSGGSLVLHDAGGQFGGAKLDGSTYSGRFYGPNAEQVGGVMSITGSDNKGKFVGSGYFEGTK